MIHNIYTLRLGAYFKIISNDEIKLLKKYPIYIQKRKLYKALERILSDYKDMTMNEDIKSNEEVFKRMERLRKAYLEILCALTILKYRESIESCIVLRKYYVITGEETREICVKKAISSLKSRKIELDDLSKDRKQSKRPKYTDFLHEVQILRREGFTIDLDRTTLAEYVQIQNIAYEQMKKKNGTRNNQ